VIPPAQPSKLAFAISPSSNAARARIRSKEALAEARLVKRLSILIKEYTTSGHKSLGRNPRSSDLVPAFEAFALDVFDAWALELLADVVLDSANDVKKFAVRLGKVAMFVVNDRIASASGVWQRAVPLSCRLADFLARQTEYGDYNEAVFMRPRIQRIVATLLARRKHWEGKAWGTVAERRARRRHRSKAATTARAILEKAKGAKKVKEFVKVLGISETAYYALGRGELRMGKGSLIELAEKLHCSPKDLYSSPDEIEL
jgi:hypothetical protein